MGRVSGGREPTGSLALRLNGERPRGAGNFPDLIKQSDKRRSGRQKILNVENAKDRTKDDQHERNDAAHDCATARLSHVPRELQRDLPKPERLGFHIEFSHCVG